MKKIVPGPTLDAKNGDKPLISVTEMTTNADINKQAREISRMCDLECDRKNCVEDYFIPVLKSKQKFEFPYIMTHVQQDPTLSTLYTQKLDFISFLTDLSSAIGFCEYRWRHLMKID